MLVSNEGAPDLRAAHIHKMFVMASSANMCSPLFLGVVLDYHGPRACSVVSICISTLGFLLFGCAGALAGGSRDAAEPIFTLAVVCIGFGRPGVQNAVIHLSNLFPARKSTVTGIITGCFQLSFCISSSSTSSGSSGASTTASFHFLRVPLRHVHAGVFGALARQALPI